MAGHLNRHLFAVVCAVLCSLCLAGAHAGPLDDWRAAATRARGLAENNAQLAHFEAMRLEASLPAGALPADRARVLNLLARAETYLALTEIASRHAREALELATRHADRVGQAEADLNLVLITIDQGKLDEQAKATQHSVDVLEGVNRPDLLGEAMLRTTVMYRRFEQFNESVAVAVQAMEIAKRSRNPLVLAYAHQGFAIAFDQSSRPEETREHYLQMRGYAQEANSRLLEAYAVGGLASAAKDAGDTYTAEILGREAIAMYREIGVPFALTFGLYGLAETFRSQGRHQEALKLFEEANAVYARYPNRIGQWFALNGLSTTYQALGQIDLARRDAEQGYAVARDLGQAVYLSGSATRLAAVAAQAGDSKRAYALTLEANRLTTQAARDRAGSRMVELIKRYESEGKQREIEALTRRNEVQASQQRWLWTILAGAFLALGGTALFMLRQRQSHRTLQRLNEQLRRSEADIRALNAGLEQRVQSRTAELRQQARYLRTLIDMLPMWAWLKDTRSRYLTVNQATAQACGVAVDDMVGKLDDDFWPAELAQAYRLDDAQVMATRQRKTVEEPGGLDGGRIWLETYKAPVLDEDGSVLGTVGVARDISDRKAAEAAREAALAEAERLARQRSEFLAQMSHELRTPLNGILGFAQILQRDKPLSERQARGLKIINESGQHLLTLINDILDLAKIDAAKLELFPVDVNLPAFVQVVGDIVRVKADEKSLLFDCEISPGLAMVVRVDEKRLRQVLLNLLSNAIKFTDSGRVVLGVTQMQGDPPGTSSAAARIRFEVSDTGIGMSEQQLARLFQPFEQVSDAQRREGGAGLGLAISRELVRLMDGDLQVQSRHGVGTVFWFELELPVSQSVASAAPGRGDPIGYDGRRRKVLVVDDVPANRTMLIDTLGLLGFEVIDAGDGQEALELAQRDRPDLIVMDVTMPVMDGYEATRRVRRTPSIADMPIIATSASVTAEVESRIRAAGANAFVSKPIERGALLDEIGRLLGLTWLCDEARPARMLNVTDLAADQTYVAPAPEEMAVLQRLARTGNMRTIRERADHLARLDARYAPFAQRLAGLAEACQTKAIARFIELHSTERDPQ